MLQVLSKHNSSRSSAADDGSVFMHSMSVGAATAAVDDGAAAVDDDPVFRRSMSVGAATADVVPVFRRSMSDSARPVDGSLRTDGHAEFGGSLRNIDEWVGFHIQQLGLQTTNTIDTEPIGYIFPNLHGVLDIIGDKTPLSQLLKYPTPGGGTCLIHCFLTLLSQNYMKLSIPDKIRIGELYRLFLSHEHFFSEHERKELSRFSITTRDGISPSNPGYFGNLSQAIGFSIGEFLKVNVIFLTDQGIDKSILLDERNDVMILNLHGHFTAIYLPFNHLLQEAKNTSQPDPRLIENISLLKNTFFHSIDAIEIIPPPPPIDLLKGNSIKYMRSQLEAIGADVSSDDTDDYVVQLYAEMFSGKKKKSKRGKLRKPKQVKRRSLSSRK